jgi:hypothetical protein
MLLNLLHQHDLFEFFSSGGYIPKKNCKREEWGTTTGHKESALRQNSGFHRDSIGTPTPKVGVELGVCGFIPSHF